MSVRPQINIKKLYIPPKKKQAKEAKKLAVAEFFFHICIVIFNFLWYFYNESIMFLEINLVPNWLNYAIWNLVKIFSLKQKAIQTPPAIIEKIKFCLFKKTAS